MDYLTDTQVANALRQFGNYRTRRVFGEAERDYDAVCWLAMGMRESLLQNIEGGAVWDGTRWVRATRPEDMDVGPFQISRRWQRDALLKMKPAVRAGTWSPYFDDHTAYDGGFCPRFEESVIFMRREFYSYRSYADSKGVAVSRRFNFCICAHNAGAGSALRAWAQGGTLADFDSVTAGGDYVSWVRKTMIQVEDWCLSHPNWTAPIEAQT